MPAQRPGSDWGPGLAATEPLGTLCAARPGGRGVSIHQRARKPGGGSPAQGTSCSYLGPWSISDGRPGRPPSPDPPWAALLTLSSLPRRNTGFCAGVNHVFRALNRPAPAPVSAPIPIVRPDRRRTRRRHIPPARQPAICRLDLRPPRRVVSGPGPTRQPTSRSTRRRCKRPGTTGTTGSGAGQSGFRMFLTR